MSLIAERPLVLGPAPGRNLLLAGVGTGANALEWYCPPPYSTCFDGQLNFMTAPNTDYWQRTHYGFMPDNGHFLHATFEGDFVLATSVQQANPNARYDQAGLMVRLSPSCWLKTSVEHRPGGPSQLGVVVTNGGFSDWSTMDFPNGVYELSLRVRREGSDYLVEASVPSNVAAATNAVASGGTPTGATGWTQLRMAHLMEDTAPCGTAAGAGGGGPSCRVAAGLYCCSPRGEGFRATFTHLTAFAGRVQGEAEH